MEAAIGASIRIGRLFGADVRLHWLCPVLALVVALRAAVADGGALSFQAKVGFALAGLGALFASVFLHEVGHVLMGLRAGGWANQIILWPLGGLAEVQGVLRRPKPQILVSLAGPLVNLALAAGFLSAIAFLRISPWKHDGLPFGQALLVLAFQANLLMFALNMVPAFPLDGGSILRWALVAFSPDGDWIRATRTSVSVGKISAVLLGIGGVVLAPPEASWLLLFVAVFAFLACDREWRILEAGLIESGDEPSFMQPEEDEEFSPEELPPPGLIERWRERRRLRRREREIQKEVEVRKRVDALLEKITRDGIHTLTEREKAFLLEASKRYTRDGTAR